MTKADLVDKVTALGDLTRRDGEVIVDTLFEAVIRALKSADKIEISGFGNLRTRQHNARQRRNHNTANAPNSATGVLNRTLNGNDQLSYRAAKIRNTNNNENAKIIQVGTPSWAFFS